MDNQVRGAAPPCAGGSLGAVRPPAPLGGGGGGHAWGGAGLPPPPRAAPREGTQRGDTGTFDLPRRCWGHRAPFGEHGAFPPPFFFWWGGGEWVCSALAPSGAAALQPRPPRGVAAALPANSCPGLFTGRGGAGLPAPPPASRRAKG